MAKTLATRMAFGKELLELAKTHDFVVCSADTKTCGLEHFGELFPGREFTFGQRFFLNLPSRRLRRLWSEVYQVIILP